MKLIENKKEISVKDFLNGKSIYFVANNFIMQPGISYTFRTSVNPNAIRLEIKFTNNTISLSYHKCEFVIDNKLYVYKFIDIHDLTKFYKNLYFYINNLSIFAYNKVSFERAIKELIFK